MDVEVEVERKKGGEGGDEVHRSINFDFDDDGWEAPGRVGWGGGEGAG